jgi:hypothetical protein
MISKTLSIGLLIPRKGLLIPSNLVLEPMVSKPLA